MAHSPTIRPYTGILDRPKMSKSELQAYENYCNQKRRSKRDGLPAPKYSAREFIGWWIENLKSYVGTTRPTCGRKDHSAGYTWSNIEMQSNADNAKEANHRNFVAIKRQAKQGKKVLVKCPRTLATIAIIPSENEAAKLFGVSQAYINHRLRDKFKMVGRWSRIKNNIPFVLERGI